MFKDWPLIKNPQFLSYPHETWWKWLPHEVIIFTKFHKDWTKYVIFSLMANFLMCPVFYSPDFKYLSKAEWSGDELSGNLLDARHGILLQRCPQRKSAHIGLRYHWMSIKSPQHVAKEHKKQSNIRSFDEKKILK